MLCTGSWLLRSGFLQLWCTGFSLQSTDSRLTGFGSCGIQAQKLWHTGLVAPGICNLPGPGIKPVSPTLVGRFPFTVPPRKSYSLSFIPYWLSVSHGSVHLLGSHLQGSVVSLENPQGSIWKDHRHSLLVGHHQLESELVWNHPVADIRDGQGPQKVSGTSMCSFT